MAKIGELAERRSSSDRKLIGERRSEDNVAMPGMASSVDPAPHYAGRGDDSKGMEICLPCHLHCGHEGHFQNFAIRPKFCRNVA